LLQQIPPGTKVYEAFTPEIPFHISARSCGRGWSGGGKQVVGAKRKGGWLLVKKVVIGAAETGPVSGTRDFLDAFCIAQGARLARAPQSIS